MAEKPSKYKHKKLLSKKKAAYNIMKRYRFSFY